MGSMRGWILVRLKHWLWRKHNRRRGKWSDYPDSLLFERYGLWPLPTQAAWKT